VYSGSRSETAAGATRAVITMHYCLDLNQFDFAFLIKRRGLSKDVLSSVNPLRLESVTFILY